MAVRPVGRSRTSESEVGAAARSGVEKRRGAGRRLIRWLDLAFTQMAMAQASPETAEGGSYACSKAAIALTG
jgi:hypothetical protein